MKRIRMLNVLAVLSLPFAAHAAEERRPVAAAGGVLDQFAAEPSVREVQEVAMRYALVSDDTLNKYQKDAVLTNLFPRTRFRYHKDTDGNQTVGVDPTGQRNVSLVDNLNNQYDVEVEWRFDQMLMGPTRVQAIRETSRLIQLRGDVLDEVTKIYFDRRRLQVELLQNPPSDPKARTAKDLRLEELTANLDGLTGGWFNARLRGGNGRK